MSNTFLRNTWYSVEFLQTFPHNLCILYYRKVKEEMGNKMAMTWIWTLLTGGGILCALLLGNGAALAAAIPRGAQEGVTLALSLGGSLCLWSGVGRLMEALGITGLLSRLLRPLLYRVFPESREDSLLAQSLSGNICANFLGLGNAATPMGMDAARRLRQGDTASHSLCRLIVLNTSSIQLIPANVAAVRSGLGCQTPFDILPAVWLTSICSAGLGLAMAVLLGKVWKDA